MADRKVVINHALCFLFSSINKYDVNLTKNTIVNFYSAREVSEAREQLLDDALSLNIKQVPRLPNRRGASGRTQRELEDILTIMAILDEAKSLYKLPRYASDNPHKMPTVQLTEGDLRAVMHRFNCLELKIDRMTAMMGDHAGGVRNVHTDLPVTAPSAYLGPTALHGPPVVQHPGSTSTAAAYSAPISNSTQRPTTTTAAAAAVAGVGSVHTNKPVGAERRINELSTTQRWAELSGGMTSTDEHNDSEPYQEVLSLTEKKKLRRKRRRMRSKENGTGDYYTTDDQNDDEAAAAGVRNYAAAAASRPKKGERLLVGKKINSQQTASNNNNTTQRGGINNIAAAKPYLSKAVFCIDNVGTNITADDMEEFVKAMDVRVVTCNQVPPRRPQWQRARGIKPTDRHAFRLCIPRDDCDKFLDADKWPEHISICRWIFKKNSRQDNVERVNTPPRSHGDSRPERGNRPTSEGGATVGDDAAATAAAWASSAIGSTPVDHQADGRETPHDTDNVAADLDETMANPYDGSEHKESDEQC